MTPNSPQWQRMLRKREHRTRARPSYRCRDLFCVTHHPCSLVSGARQEEMGAREASTSPLRFCRNLVHQACPASWRGGRTFVRELSPVCPDRTGLAEADAPPLLEWLEDMGEHGRPGQPPKMNAVMLLDEASHCTLTTTVKRRSLSSSCSPPGRCWPHPTETSLCCDLTGQTRADVGERMKTCICKLECFSVSHQPLDAFCAFSGRKLQCSLFRSSSVIRASADPSTVSTSCRED